MGRARLVSAALAAALTLLATACTSSTRAVESAPTAPSTTTTTVPPQVPVTPYEQLMFLAMAGHAPTGDVAVPGTRAAMLEKWTHDVHVTIDGAPTPTDVARVQQTVDALATLMAPRRVTVGGGRDIVVSFVPKAEFAAALGSSDYPSYADGVTRPLVETGVDAGALHSAHIVIDSGIAQYGRNRVITHELLHAIGLDHTACTSSVMFGESRTDTSPRWTMSAFDQRMVQLLYRPELAAGMSPARAAKVLVPTAATGVTCEPVTWQVVIDADTNQPYFCAVTPERYRPCTSDVADEVTGPIEHPDLWFDGTYVYDSLPG